MTRTFLFTAACLALALGCTPPPLAELTEDDLAAIRHRFDEVARHLSPEDNEAWANDFTEDAQFMFQNTPTIRGREAIRAWGEDTSETGSGVALSASFSDIEIHGSGDWAWATSSYVLTVEGVEGPDRGKQLVVLQRQPDGTWLTAAVHVSSDLPPPGN
jgi:uncharacterized protein (TIGR02246 family)